MALISVLIPSRLKKVRDGSREQYFFERAIASARRQMAVASGSARVQIVLGVDVDADVPVDLIQNLGVEVAASSGKSQAAALNAAAEKIDGDYVAILEDDDQWEPEYLAIVLESLSTFDFASTNQTEIDLDGRAVGIRDFPTPSGWLMRRHVWESVGGFNAAFRWHLDNEWLGRLNERGFKRVHFVDTSTPPLDRIRNICLLDRLSGRSKSLKARRFLLRLCAENPNLQLMRHPLPDPLVKRQIHPDSGMSQIAGCGGLSKQSQDEYALLTKRFGRIPS